MVLMSLWPANGKDLWRYVATRQMNARINKPTDRQRQTDKTTDDGRPARQNAE